MATATGRFRRADRLRRSGEFRRVMRRGRRIASDYFVLFAARPEAPNTGRRRLGLTVSRRVGNAVVRNRVKRRVREWFRRSPGEDRPRLEIVVIARRGCVDLAGQKLELELDRLLSSAGKTR